jgi:toluene monooxygenase system protein E
MSETAKSTARARRLKTWSRLGDLGRAPTEYEIVTHGMNHTASLETPLEMGLHNFGNQWIVRHRDGVPLRVDGWDGFRDPDALTYRKYNQQQDAAETFVDEAIEEYAVRQARDHGLGAAWREALKDLLATQRYPVHGLQMLACYVAQMAPSSYMTNCATFQAADELRRVQRIAYRTKQLALAHPGHGFGVGERARWEKGEGWQPVRRAVEQILVVYDWDEAFAALCLVVKPAYDEVFLRQLARAARAAGDELDALLCDNLFQDAARARRWSAALARFAVERRADNRAVLAGYVAKWAPAADAIAGAGAALFQAHGCDMGADFQAAAHEALAALHEQAGL